VLGSFHGIQEGAIYLNNCCPRFQLKDELVFKERGDVMGGRQQAATWGLCMVSSYMGTCISPRRVVAERANVIKAINSN
jgi:hypothetical protein